MKKTKKIALTGVFTALALAFSYIEFLIPFDMLGIPGIKPGFANLVVMAALYTLGLPYAAAVSLVRILLSFLLFGNVTSLLYSLAGGVLSLTVMFILKKTNVFGHIGVSVGGAVSHNIAQTAVSFIILSFGAVVYYVPVLLLSAVLFGVINGSILKLILSRADKLFK
jgi:heptaprenyl diphosphate synthase